MHRKTTTIAVVAIVLLMVGTSFSQAVSDSTVSVPVVTKSPRGAVLRSLLFPGLGQWYNGQKLKALVVFAGEAALVGNAVYYHQKAVQSADEAERAFYEDNQSRFTWLWVAAHLLSLLDAYVDAHLWDFDTGPDLSVRTDRNTGRSFLLSFSWRL